MEVFPLEEGTATEMDVASMSQAERLKSWDASFAHLEKMLKEACDCEATEDVEQEDSNFSREFSPPLTTLTDRPQSPSLNENKRKRDDVETSSHDELEKVKVARTCSDITVTSMLSPHQSQDASSVNMEEVSHTSSAGLSETSDFTKDEETAELFQHQTDMLNEQNNSSDSIFQHSNSSKAEHENTPFLEEEKCLSLSDENARYSFLECKERTSFIDNEQNRTHESDNTCNAVMCKESSIIISQSENDNVESKSESSINIENDDGGESNNIKNNDSSPVFSDVSENITVKKEEELPSSSDKDMDSLSGVSNENIMKKDTKEKEEHSDKSSKKDDKLLKKKKFERCNIRDIKLEDELDAVTLSAQKEEQERIKRLQEAQMRALQERLQIIEVEKEALSQLFSHPNADEPNLFASTPESESTESSEMDDKSKISLIKSETDVILLESSDEDKKPKIEEIIPTPVESEDVIDISSSSSDDGDSDSDDSDKKDDDVLVLSDEGEPEPEPGGDPNNSGAHTNDCFNLPDLEGRVLVNVGHPPEDPDIYLAPQIAKVIKPHQIGGIRFLYDNVVENLERYKSSSGFGCILAHSMGLGKTVQVVSFVDVFLRHTPATLVLCIVPINTIQNWKAEFDMWVPATAAVENEQVESGEIRPRDYTVYTLNENYKTMAARSSLIEEWRSNSGVLLMGYEMYRMLALRKMPKIPIKKGRRLKKQEIPIEPETNEQIKKFMDQMYEHIVIPGPDLVICDEGHRIKNSLASTSMALKSIKTRRRVVLTGYPLQNNLLEYWCMVDFVRPNYLGSRAEFCNMFERPISNGQCIDSTPRDRQLMRFRSHVLHSLLVGFVQRRGHSVLRAVLPKKEEHVLLIRMTTIQRELYKCFVKDLLYIQQATNPLKLFAVCCKIWNHPDILYKLLQEKRAQEDIDLDIDISTGATNTAVVGSSALMRRKALTKDQSKCKPLQRTMKSQQMKIQVTDLNVTKTEQVMQTSQCQMQNPLLSIKKENQLGDKNTSQNSPQEQGQFPNLSPQLCKDEYMNSSIGNQQSQNHGYPPSMQQSFPQNQFPQQSSSSFCPQNYTHQTNMQQCQTSTKSSSQYSQHLQYPLKSQQQSQSFVNNPTPQQQFPLSSQSAYSPGSSSQQYSQQSTNSPQVPSQQQYNLPQSTSIDQNFSTQVSNTENFQQVPQFPTQNSTQLYQQQSTLQPQYPQTFSQQKPATSKSQIQFKQEPNSQQFNMQQSTQPISTQLSYNQTPQSNQQQYNSSNVSQYSSQQQQFTPSTPSPQQYGPQGNQNFNEHSSYAEKNSSQLTTYSEQSTSDSQQLRDQNAMQYTDHSTMQQFNQPSPITQQFCQSPAPQPQFAQRSQTSQNKSQSTFPQPPALESQIPFSTQASPNSKMHQQASPQQHFSQQSSPHFPQQASSMPSFSQCSPSQQQSYSQQSPPLQQSPTQQQFPLPSPTQQPYPQTFPQSASNQQQFSPQTPLQYPQETSPQQTYSQPTYGHQSSSQQYPQHSSPQQQQQFSHHPTKQSYGQQFMQPNTQYPRQPSPQQHFGQQNRQGQFNHQQQQFGQQSVTQFNPLTPQYPQQINQSQYPPVSPQPSNKSQQFSSPQAGSNLSFNQPPRQQFNSDQYPIQIPQNKSQQSYGQQTTQSVSSSQYNQSSAKTQYSQASPSPSFMQPQSPSSQAYSQQNQGTCQQKASAQFQHSVPQQGNQSSQSSFQMQYQSQTQPSMQPPSQVPSNNLQSNSKQVTIKGKSKSNVMHKSTEHMEHMQSTNFSQQPFQNNGLDQSLSQQQSMKPGQTTLSSNFQPISSSLVKQENFVMESVKDDSEYPARCSKAILKQIKAPSNTATNSMQYPHGQIKQDVVKTDGDLISNVNQDAVMAPIRERVDSSINYEWAIPIMKDYLVGVLKNSHKMMVLFAIIEKTILNGDKLLVFSQSLSTLDLLEHFLCKTAVPIQINIDENCVPEYWCRNKNYFRLDGSTSAQEREKLINEFNKNDTVCLFLLSTRAGCLGINLVGANRIVVMDASWNPCHDAQAVCRIYRYGQKKQCYIYRLVTDNSLEKRIYDRQVNKQGMSDRVVDELNPESNFTWKDVTTLIQDDEDDGPEQDLLKYEESYTDEVLKYLVTKMSLSLSKEPFEHESLLLDRKDLKLTKQEKRLAKQSYEMAKRANMINIRTTYTYMPNDGQFVINNKQCQWVGGTTVRVTPGQAGRGAGTRAGTTATPITASPSLMNNLFKQGVMVQKLTMPSTISIPVLTPGAPPVVVPAGQDVLVLRTPKGVYLRLPDGRIIAVQLPPSLLAKTQFRPNVVTHFRPNMKGNNQNSGGRGQSIGIIKQTLQCGGTVRYLGPKNTPGSAAQNTGRNTAPEVIDLSDDDEPSIKKISIGDRCAPETDAESSEKDPNLTFSKSNIFQGKQITIRRVSPSVQQNTIPTSNSKGKCDLPLKLQQNQQITIMPINPSNPQKRPKLAPQLAQPVRVQQMLLQPDQSKKKPLTKTPVKIQLSSLAMNKHFQRQQITVTPTHPVQLQKTRNLPHSFQKSFEGSNSPKITEEHSNPSTSNSSSSSSPIPLGDVSKRLEVSVQNLDQRSDSQIDLKECSNSISISVSNSNSLPVKSMNINLPQVTMTPAATLPEVIKPLSSISEMNQQISSLMSENLDGSTGTSSHNMPIQPDLVSKSSPILPISISQNLPPSLSLTPISQPMSHPLPQTKSSNFTSAAPSTSSGLMLFDSSQGDSQLHKSILSSPQNVDQLNKIPTEIPQHLMDSDLPSINQKLAHVSHSMPQLDNKHLQPQKNVIDPDTLSNSATVPNTSESSVHNAAKTDIHESSIQIPKVLQPPSYNVEAPQNGQLQSNLPYMQQPSSRVQQATGLHSSVSHVQPQAQTNSKKKKTSRQTTKKTSQQSSTHSSQLMPQTSEALHQISHPSMSEHLHDPHHFPPFSHHSLPSSEFPPFQNYATHKPLVHIQHPQPLHPLQHSQEHPLSSHLPPISHLYPMPPHMTGNPPSLSDIQSQPSWAVSQSSISSFNPFSQSSQYYSSPHENNQFSFPPSSFTLPQPASSHITQPEPNVTILPGLEHVSNSLSSEL